MTTASAISTPCVSPAGPLRGLTRRWRATSNRESAGGVVERVLAARGLSDPGAIRKFCEPKLSDLHDPGLLPQIDAAAQRIIQALRSDEVIVIYGDYDVDGIAA